MGQVLDFALPTQGLSGVSEVAERACRRVPASSDLRILCRGVARDTARDAVLYTSFPASAACHDE